MANKYFKAIEYNTWKRNVNWPLIPEDDGLDNKVYGVYAVFEDEDNTAALFMNNWTNIDWGDGTTDSRVVSNVTESKTHTYDYATLSGPVLTYEDGRNYKTVLVEIIMDNSSNDIVILMGGDSSEVGTSNWLDIECRLDGTSTNSATPNSYLMRVGDTRLTPYLERFGAKYPLSDGGGTRLFRFCVRLEVLDVPSDFFNYVTLGSNNLFNGTSSMAKNPPVYPDISFNIPIGTSISLWRNSARAILGNITFPNATAGNSTNIHGQVLKCGDVSAPNFTSAIYFFGGTVGEQLAGGIGEINFPNVGDARFMFRNAKMPEVVFTDCSSFTNCSDMFLGTGNIRKLIMPGLTVGVSVADNNMRATEIDDFFTSLGTASGTQTIDVSGNPGSATCNTSIATGKGFTVIT